MKELFLLLLFIVGAVCAIPEYHGDRRFWTVVDSNGRTKVALHVLNEPVNLVFPKDKTVAQLLSDMKLLSPSGNVQCQDTTNKMGFTLLFDDRNHIRGEIKMELDVDGQKVKMFLYQKCGDVELSSYYATRIIEGTEQKLESAGRSCFKNGEPSFRQHGTNTGDNVMELKVSPGAPGAFGCQAFMILPEYMHVEDERLPEYTKLPLNITTFDGHDEKFWWKSETDSMLPDQISFDSSKNVVINILNSTKDVPYFFRIGSGQPIPAFKFNFGAKCKHTKFKLYLNLKSECQVLLHLSENGFLVSTKSTPNIDFKGLPSLMVFGGKHASVKVETPLSVKSLGMCELSNEPDVPLDQFVLQISPIGDVGGCEKAEIVLLNSDVINGTEVLIDRLKIVESINATTKIENNSSFASVVTTPKSFVESAEFAWWWILVGGILLIGIIVGIIVFVICIRRRRQQKKKLPPVESIVEDEEIGRITIKTKTALSPGKLSKEKQPKIVGKEKKEEQAKKKAPKEAAAAKGNQKHAKLQSIQPPKPIQKPKSEPPPQSAEQSKQPPKSLKPASTQKSGTKREPPPPAILPKPLRNLKFRSIYGTDKETKLDEPFDYHENESSKFEPTKIPPKFVQPGFQIFTNFWDCIGEILTTKRLCPVYADNFDGGHTNVYFIVRDLVSNEKYLPLRCLSNRMLEDFELPKKKSPFVDVDKDGKQRIKTDGYYCLRVFILSYDPLTVEIHCRGPWPHFIFDVCDCPRCMDLFEELDKNKWKKSPTACDEDWDTFVCRVKRAPSNSHQFVSYYGGAGVYEPDNPNDINNIFILRGQWQFDQLRECSRGCFVPTEKSHVLNFDFDFETRLRHSPPPSE